MVGDVSGLAVSRERLVILLSVCVCVGRIDCDLVKCWCRDREEGGGGRRRSRLLAGQPTRAWKEGRQADMLVSKRKQNVSLLERMRSRNAMFRAHCEGKQEQQQRREIDSDSDSINITLTKSVYSSIPTPSIPNPSPSPTPVQIPLLLLLQTPRHNRHPRLPHHSLPPTLTNRPQPKKPINHRLRRQHTTLTIHQLRLRPRRDSDRAAERRGSSDDAGASWRSGAGG